MKTVARHEPIHPVPETSVAGGNGLTTDAAWRSFTRIPACQYFSVSGFAFEISAFKRFCFF
jgi:hypothetical protein